MDGAPVQEFSLQRKWDTTGWSGNFLYYWRNIKSLFWAIRKLINDGKLRTDHWERYLEHEGQIYIGAIEPPVNARDAVESLGQEDPLEEEMATHSSVLAWEIPWTEEPGGLPCLGSQRAGHDWGTNILNVCQGCTKNYCVSFLEIFIATL